MYLMDGKQYLFVAAASTASGRGIAPATAPMGWVAYALPAK
jgi:hypothetical protein